MTALRRTVEILAVLVIGIGTLPVPATGGPEALPRLPAARVYGSAADSPGKVTFEHRSHVDAGRPACTACHPGQFRILTSTARGPVVHAEMEAGRQCGACHNGRAAFGLQECELCHQK